MNCWISNNSKVFALVILTIIGFIWTLVLFTAGGIHLWNESGKVSNYGPSSCLVQSAGIRTYQCKGTLSVYTCYGAVWNVSYGIFRNQTAEIRDNLKFSDDSQTKTRFDKYQIGANYSCWYGMTQIPLAQWDEPDRKTGAMILMFGCFVAVVTLISFVLTIIFTRQATGQNSYESVSP